jgi:poly-gamma-glutamate capsule biosynthesis protein CapA/YwtB (metallophosphatase superfamily)
MGIERLYIRLTILVIFLFITTGCRTAKPTVSTAQPPAHLESFATDPEPVNTLMPTATPTLTQTNSAAPSVQVTLIAVGDMMLGRTVGEQIVAKGPQVVFTGVQSVLDAADILVGNLECALTNLGTPEHKSYLLKAPLSAARALSLGKFDVVSLANNHAMDYGFQGLADAQKNLSLLGIASVGAGANYAQAHAPVFLQHNGLHLAFLAYVDVPVEKDGFDAHTWIATDSRPGVAWAYPDQIKADVAAARLKADLVVVLLHSGIEISTYMSDVTDNQRSEAHAAIDAGAALVLGSHPHQLQPIERYHGGLIAYSLGNFVFDDYRGIANATIILRVVLTRAGVQSYGYIPVLIDNGLPHVITEDLAPAISTMVAPINP